MTYYMDVRMNQRGITGDLVNLVPEHGEWSGDRCRLDKKGLKNLIENLDGTRAAAWRTLDKGGVVVVEAGGDTITTYPMRARRGTKR